MAGPVNILSTKGKTGVFSFQGLNKGSISESSVGDAILPNVWSWQGSCEGIFTILLVPAPHFPGSLEVCGRSVAGRGEKDKGGCLVIFEINDFHTCQYHV